MDALLPRSVEVSHRRMLALALPMTVSHVTTPLLGLVDATVIGRLGEASLLGEPDQRLVKSGESLPVESRSLAVLRRLA